MKLAWCHYEVQRSIQPSGGLYIQGNGTWQGSGSAHILAEDGIKFPQQGNDAVLWLIRDGKAESLATRAHGRIGFVNLKIDQEFNMAKGIHIQAGSPWLKPGDGFAILPLGTTCQAGKLDTEDGYPRPTMVE